METKRNMDRCLNIIRQQTKKGIPTTAKDLVENAGLGNKAVAEAMNHLEMDGDIYAGKDGYFALEPNGSAPASEPSDRSLPRFRAGDICMHKLTRECVLILEVHADKAMDFPQYTVRTREYKQANIWEQELLPSEQKTLEGGAE